MHDPALDSTIDAGGLLLHYREYPGPDRPLVLLHGVASNARIWIMVGPLLSQQFHVYALDQRGHGESEAPDSGYDFASVVGDLASFIEGHGLERPVIVGHSWGGNVALEYATTYPKRPAGIILVDGGFMEISGQPEMTWERTEQQLAPPDLTHLTREQFLERARQWQLGPLWREEVEAAVMGNFRVTEGGTIAPYLSRANHMQVVRALWEQRPSALYQDVRCPTLFIACEREVEGRAQEWMARKREAIEQAQEAIEDCQVSWFADTIHDIPLQRPKELAEAIGRFALKLDS